MTYALTDLSLRYLDRQEEIRYADLAEVTAALMQSMFAIQSRITDLYELDRKTEYGDLPMILQIRNRIYDRIWSRPMQSRGA